MTDFESEHLTIDWQDKVWLETKTWTSCLPSLLAWLSSCESPDYTPNENGEGPVCLGSVDRDPKWPVEKLGPEPTWYLTELADLRDQWHEKDEQDYHAKGRSCQSHP